MGKSESKRKSHIVLLIVIYFLALCFGIGVALSFGQKGNVAAPVPTDDAVAQKQYTFGQTYTIDGKQYTLGEKENEYMDYYTALGLSREEYIVSLTKYTYLDGTDRTEGTTAVRNAGTYEFEIEPLNGEVEIYSDIVTVAAQRVIVDVNRIGAFVNAENSSQWPAHGDKNVIYQHNDGWYAAAIGDKAIVNTRTVTNATYGKGAVNIRIKNEILTGDEIVAAEGHAGYTLNWSEIWKEGAKGWADVEWDNIDLKATSWTSKHPGSTNSIYRYNDGTKNVNIGITSRIGTSFDKTGEYVASFTFNAPDNYVFDYSDESKLYDEYKGLNVPESNRGTNSFVLTKYWYILESGGTIGVRGYWNGGETFVPFATGSGSILDYDHTDYTTPDNEKKYLIVDSISYGDVIHTNEPNVDEGETLTFEIEFEPVNGTGKKKIRELTGYVPAAKWKYIGQVGSKYKWEEESYTIPEGKEASTLPYYFNSSMPAGKYTLYLYLDKPGSARLSGIYTLTVLPKSFDSIALNQGEENPLTALHNVIRGQETSNGSGQYRNSYAVGTKKVHEDITGALAKLNAKLLYYNKSSRIGYWASTDSDDYNDLYDNAVTIMYSRGDGYGGSADFSLSDILGSLTLPNTYTMYYSISAKNYVTAGGARSGDFDHYGFMLWLFDGYNIKDIYDMMNETNGRYFQGGKYTGNQVTTTPYTNNYFDADYDFDDSNVDYVNAGKAYVRLTLKDKSNTYWDTSKLAHADEKVGWFEEYYSDYFKFDGDDLLVYYTISPADNEWTIAPQMATWNYDSFNKANNNITGKLKFDVTNKSDVKFRIGKKTEAGGFVWLKLTSALANNTISYTFDSEGTQFVVDESGQVGDDIAAALKQFDVGTYYLESHVPAIKKSNSDTVNVKEFTLDKDNYIEITVAQTQNSWATIPYVIGWAYQGFDTSNFNAGVPYYFVTSGEVVEYALYEGSDTSGEGRPLTVTRTQAQEGGEDTYSLSQDTVAYLNGLSAKQYTVVASYKGTDNYADMSLSIFFSVAQAQNNWTQAPYMIGWAYDNFSAGNFQSGTARFKNNADIQYTLYKQVEKPVAGEQGKTETVSEPIDGWNSFTEIDESIERKFNALGAGDYKLVASLTGTTDYADLSLDILFSVSQTQNSWKVGYSPYMLGWAYTGFKSGTGGNFQAGIPFYNRTAGEVVTYTLYEGTDTSITDKYKFTFTDIDGYISGEGAENSDANKVVNKFKALPAKTYTLVAFYKGTADYADLSLDMVFSVTQVQNTWQTPPSVIGWTYGANAANLFTPGVPNFPESNPTVNYTLYKTVQQSEQKQWGPISDEATVKSNIADLGAGQYRLYVKVDSTTDYTVLELSVSFNVEQAQNTWTVTPAVIGWTFGANPANLFTAGVPAFPKNNAKVSYTLSKVKENETDSDFTPKELSSEAAVTAELKDLGAGKYELVAAVTGTPDYTALSLTVSFNVAQAQNTWTVTPAVIGWTYGGYDAKFFTAGVPSFPTESYEVQYTLTKDGKSSAEWTKTEKSDIDSAFNTLGAGGYTLVAEVVGNTNYTGLRLSITFNVAKAQNSWKNGKAPFITGWAYQGFVASTNFQGGEDSRTGSAKKTVVYTLYSETEHTTKPDGWENTFTSVDSTIAGKFKALPFGTYNLHAFLEGDTNYEALELYIVFSVTQAQNTWPTTPSVIGWTYGGYDAKFFTAGVPSFPTESYEVQYTLTKDGKSSAEWTKTEKSDIDSAFNTLGAGGYTLVAEVVGNTNYTGLRLSITFNVAKAQNSWKNGKAPFITGWAYRGFVASTNFQGGEDSRTGEGEKTVVYSLYSGTEHTTKPDGWEQTFTSIGAVESKFEALPVGTYNLHAFLVGDDNYEDLELYIVFSVSKADNSWPTAPVMVGWQYRGLTAEIAKSNFRAAKARFDEQPETNKITYTVTSGIQTADTEEQAELMSINLEVDQYGRLTSDTIQELNEKLIVGGYTLEVALTGTNNYKDLSVSVPFNITQAANGWATIPTISSWTYGDTYNDKSLDSVEIVEGKATLGNVKYTVQYVDSYGTVGDNVENFEDLAFKKIQDSDEDGLKEKLLGGTVAGLVGLDAGSYNLHVEVKETTDYAAISRDIRFTVSKAENGWDIVPTISGWTFGEKPKSHNNPKPNVETGNQIQYKYYAAKNEGGQSVDYDREIVDLSAAFAGDYAMVVTLTGNKNYNNLVEIVYFTIAKQEIKWDEATAPERVEWYLSEADNLADNALTKVAVKTASGQTVVSYTLSYAISKAVGSSYNPVTTVSVTVNGAERDLDALLSALKALEAGIYRIVITAILGADGNFDLQPLTVGVEVKLSEPTIEEDPSGGSGGSGSRVYNWNWGDSDEQKTLSDMKVSQEGAVITYRIGFESTWSTEYDNFATMLKDLRAKDAGTYTVEYIVRCENYATITRTVTVNISAATNDWEKKFNNSIDTNISWTWKEFVSTLLQMPKAYYGNEFVLYTILKNDVAFTTFRASDYTEGDDEKTSYERLFDAFVNAVKDWNAGKYRVTVSIDKTTNYSACSFTYTFTINKVTTVWDSDTAGTNGSSITESYGSTFADLNEPVSGSDWGKKALYTLKFSSASDALYSGDSWSALIARLRECEAEEDDYTITAFIDGDDNHMALNYSITVKITVQGNSWKEQTGSADNPSSKRIEWTYGSNVAPNIVFVPTYNASKLIVKVGTALTDGIEVPYANLIDYIKGLDVGTYTITASVDADKKYGGLSDTVYLTIIKANNAWEGDLTISGWTWNKVESEISFTLNLPVPKYSASAKVYVYQISNLEEAVITANITYADGKVNVNDYNALVLKLKGLNVATGGYRIEVVADEQPNYNECRGQTKDFTIAQAENRWTTKPVLIVDGEREDGPKYTWVYRTKVTYEATALFGDVIVKFTDTATGDDDYVTIPTEIGTYKATFLVAATGNYKGVAKYELEFTITGVTDRSFSVLPGVTGWAWHNYSRSTNLFVGTPTSGGKVTFKILSQDGSKKIEFELVNEDGTGAGVYVPKDKLDELNDLTAGTYRLILSVGSRDFYTAFEYEVSFTVVEADNDWTVLPQIANWTYGDYQEEINKPIAESRYGTPTIIITARDSEDDVYYNGIDINRLEDALVGWYVMTVSVDGSRGRYKAKEEIVIQFQVFANTDQNYWEDVPRIEGWTANIDEIVNLPSGQPHYGKPYFEFYNAQLVNDEYVRGGPIEDGVDSILISNSMYARDFYMPTKPGVYIMLAFAENGVDSKDDLTENHFSGVVFTIRDRVIEWTQNVRIASVLYLGEKNKWAEPTAKTNLTGIDKVDITYRYLDALTRRDLGSQIPTEVGKYIVVARANARYTQYITSEMMFDVMLSKNSWVGDELPTIGSWSEEFNSKSPNPMGEALHGNIFYMYIDKANPDIILTEKPTKAGNYIMIARVELDGYETLEARYEFTIEPAYDSTFVVIDIILGLVACVFAVVVIVFAIRRYKENG